MTNCKMVGALPNHRQRLDWLQPFLNARYFSRCRIHGDERKYFCTDCIVGPLCLDGRLQHAGHRTFQVRKSSHHNAIRIADIQKMLDISQIQPYVINNAKIVFLMPRPQPQQHPFKEPEDWTKVCRTCKRKLSDPARYCSIDCKRRAVREKVDERCMSIGPLSQAMGAGLCAPVQQFAIPSSNCCEECEGGEFSFSMPPKKRRQLKQLEAPAVARPVPYHESFGACSPATGGSELSLSSNISFPLSPSTPPSSTEPPVFRMSSSRRKGIPRRAPLF